VSMNNLEEKYIIFGINRMAKDFCFFFDKMNVVGFVKDDEGYLYNEFLGLPVWSLNKISEKETKVIICDFESEKKEDKLKKMGYVKNKDYYLADQFIDRLPGFKIPTNKKIIIWGTGIKAEIFLKYFTLDIDFFVDNYNYGQLFHDKQVFNPEEISDWKDYYIIVAVKRDSKIVEQIHRYGVLDNQYVSYREILQSPSYLLKRTIYDKTCVDLECNTMTNHLEISGTDATCCCTTFVNVGMGNFVNENYEDIWNNTIHKILSLSCQNQTYSFCNKEICPLFENVEQCECDLNKEYNRVAEGPLVLSAGFDATCNLKCETCRKDYKVLSDKEKYNVQVIKNKIINDVLKHLDFIILAGEGEVFASKACKDIYLDSACKQIKYFRILTNGMLFTPQRWKEFVAGKKNAKIMLTISVDAATKKTYEKIRRGGDFEVLKRNLKFASNLRKAGEIIYFRINFVAQRNNYEEMPAFVCLGRELDVDEVFFTKILNWGTYTNEEFERISMMEKDGITPKPEFEKILKNPIMNDPIVDLGTIRGVKQERSIQGVVKNYYMWELERKNNNIFL